MVSPIRILLVEDTPEDAELLSAWLSAVPDLRARVVRVETVRQAESLLERELFDLVLLDLTLPDARGLQALHRLREHVPTTPIVVLTARQDNELSVQAVREGAQDFLVKSQVEPRSLARSMAYAIERMRAGEALRQSEERFRAIFENAPCGMVLIDSTGRFVRVNRKFLAVSGWSLGDLVDHEFTQALHPEDVPRAIAQFQKLMSGEQEHVHAEYRFLRADGGTDWGLASGSVLRDREGRPDAMVGTVEYVTERRRLESPLVNAQKMEAVGRLAGGIAHDFNNLLTAITGYADLLVQRLAPGEGREEVEEIRRSARRAGALTLQLLTFSRRQMTRPQPVDVAALVAHKEETLRRLLGDQVDLQLDLEPVGPFQADPGQMEQVLVNLVVNAREAMPRGGRVRIRTREALVVPPPDAEGAAFASADPRVCAILTVEDSGPGISPEIRPHLFEPFFTTKPPEKGAGLGLSSVYGVVRQAGGFIVVESQAGAGSAFHLHFPLGAPLPEPRPEPTGEPGAPTGATILLVEDDPTIRRLVPLVLEARGFRVLSAADGEEALAEAGRFRGTIDMVLSDVLLPGLSGPEVVEALKETRPDLKVLLCSGYTPDSSLRQDILGGRVEFLPKPFTPAELVAAVQRVLGSG